VRGPFPSKEIRRISERADPSKERVGDWGGLATVWSLLCVAETRPTRPNGDWGYSPSEVRKEVQGPVGHGLFKASDPLGINYKNLK